jgi:hypothetical protein
VLRLLRWRCALVSVDGPTPEVVVLLGPGDPHPADLPGWIPRA